MAIPQRDDGLARPRVGAQLGDALRDLSLDADAVRAPERAVVLGVRLELRRQVDQSLRIAERADQLERLRGRDPLVEAAAGADG